jgi:hypothetical protein
MIVEFGHVLLKGVKLINFFYSLGLYSLRMSSPLIMVVILWPGWRGFFNSIHFSAEGMIGAFGKGDFVIGHEGKKRCFYEIK